ncbi:sulfotransferase family protein [Nonomuraea typhae]|uniref:sulfotransferase family protein n=1 Tax=Nonomuraea typhae TaxID=2603600 RepID=UPI0012F90812|nr:sulfotransferase family protein [Nonomuraea typhae]
MKVIGAGFGRTGTTSLKMALERLGYGPCYHMFDIVEEPARIGTWIDAAEGRQVDWDRAFQGYGSAVDFPVAAFWRELTARYPDAKVILTVRDPDAWYDSATRTIFKKARRARRLSGGIGLKLVSWLAPDLAAFVRMTDTAIMRRVFAGNVADRRHALEVFDRHIKDVVAEVPQQRLLVYDVSQGWEPLCDFLGEAVPGEPFPRGNDARTFEQEERERVRRLIARRR